MTKAAILVIAAINSLVLYFAAFLGVGGDGSADGVYTIWVVGYLVIAAFTVWALRSANKGGEGAGVKTALLSLPGAFAVGLVLLLLVSAFDYVKPNSPELAQACKEAGARFFAAPSAPVSSLAFDWPDGSYPPFYNKFSVTNGSRVSGLGYRRPNYPVAIQFDEKRKESDSANRIGYFGVKTITADVLVFYNSSSVTQTLRQYEISVSDRRDGRTLARLRYYLDQSNRRGCGTTSEGTMDEVEFVMKAAGLR